MIYNLPANNLYGDLPVTIDFPDNWEIHVSEINGYNKKPMECTELKKAMDQPVGVPTIKEGAKNKKSAVIIIDDITRPTPCKEIAEIVIDELLEARVAKENIWFIAALGGHGPMVREDFIRKLGEDIVDTFEIYNHNVFYNHVYLGTTSNGIPVEINQDVMTAEYKIAIGTMMPHSFYGFSGGAKSILPGIASMNTIIKNHSFTSPSEFNMGNPDTRIRKDAEEAAAMMGLDFKIDVILNGNAKVCKLFCGDFREEAEAARIYAREHYKAKFIPDCDIVISNSYFKPLEAACAYTPETIASLKEGGDYILSAHSPYGCCVHYLYDKWGKSAPGGTMWAGTYAPEDKMKNMIVFSKYTVKGMRDSWFVEEGKGAEYIKDWQEILKILDDGTKKKVVIYPMAESQVLDNSREFYD